MCEASIAPALRPNPLWGCNK